MATHTNLNDLFTDIADAIREKTGDTDTIVADDFPSEIINIPSGEDISDYLADTIRQGDNYYSGVDALIKKLPSPLSISGTNLNYAFKYCNNLEEIPQIDTSNVTTMIQTFLRCQKITTIPMINTSNVTDMQGLFISCSNLKTIPQLDTSKVTSFQNFVSDCGALESIPELDASSCNYVSGFLGTGWMNNLTSFGGLKNLGKAYLTSASANYNRYTLDISRARNLLKSDLMNVINNLYDIASAGVATQNLVLGAAHLPKLTAEEIAIATNKGWTVS